MVLGFWPAIAPKYQGIDFGFRNNRKITKIMGNAGVQPRTERPRGIPDCNVNVAIVAVFGFVQCLKAATTKSLVAVTESQAYYFPYKNLQQSPEFCMLNCMLSK